MIINKMIVLYLEKISTPGNKREVYILFSVSKMPIIFHASIMIVIIHIITIEIVLLIIPQSTRNTTTQSIKSIHLSI